MNYVRIIPTGGFTGISVFFYLSAISRWADPLLYIILTVFD
jgi:hypothetical protein